MMLVTPVVLSVSLMRIRVRHKISHPPALALKTYSPENLIWWGHPENGNISGNAEAKAKLVEILNPKIMHLTIKKENEGVQGPI